MSFWNLETDKYPLTDEDREQIARQIREGFTAGDLNDDGE